MDRSNFGNVGLEKQHFFYKKQHFYFIKRQLKVEKIGKKHDNHTNVCRSANIPTKKEQYSHEKSGLANKQFWSFIV